VWKNTEFQIMLDCELCDGLGCVLFICILSESLRYIIGLLSTDFLLNDRVDFCVIPFS
jgi:hypothetical protein